MPIVWTHTRCRTQVDKNRQNRTRLVWTQNAVTVDYLSHGFFQTCTHLHKHKCEDVFLVPLFKEIVGLLAWNSPLMKSFALTKAVMNHKVKHNWTPEAYEIRLVTVLKTKFASTEENFKKDHICLHWFFIPSDNVLLCKVKLVGYQLFITFMLCCLQT